MTEEEWYALDEGEEEGLGHTRKEMLSISLMLQVHHMENDLPTSPGENTDEAHVMFFPAAFRAGMGKLAKAELPPVWALCELTSEISRTRNMVEWVYGETLARKRMMMCLGRNAEEESQVLEWLYERWGQQIWPSGIPKDLATAQALLGKTKARLDKVVARGTPHHALNHMLRQSDGLIKAITQLKEDEE